MKMREESGNMKEKLPEGWEKVARIFSGQPKPDHVEFFVERVMEQVHRPESAAYPRLWPVRWWVPALAPGLALLLMAVVAGRAPAVSTEMLLDTGSSGWVARIRPSSGSLLELMEEGS